jgi:hypothetical protein
MKKVFLSTLIVFLLVSAQTQNSNLSFGVGLNLGIPAKNLSGSSIAAGADLMAHYSLAKEVALTGDVGYTALFAKNNGNTTNIIPLRVGLRYYPVSSFFLGGKIGAGFLSGNGSVTTTAYSLGGGFKIDRQLELGASYDAYSKNGTIGLVNIRLGYFF